MHFYDNCFKSLSGNSQHQIHLYWYQLTVFSHSSCDFLCSWCNELKNHSFLVVLTLCCCRRAFACCSVRGWLFACQALGFSLCWLLLSWSAGSRHTGFSSGSTQVHWIWYSASAAPQLLYTLIDMDSSWTRVEPLFLSLAGGSHPLYYQGSLMQYIF